jgi:ABC-type Fe3+-hydroxamate transport system substrate-binding protein
MQKGRFTDQLSRQVSIPFPPRRIISLVPSQTELLFDLGLGEELVGITKFCIHPTDQFKLKTKVGGTKKLKLDVIRNLKPDLIIGNKEENAKEQIEELMEEFAVWMSDISNLKEALEMITGLGLLTGKEERAEEIAEQVRKRFSDLALQNSHTANRVAYFIWKDPFMAAGTGTFIHDILIQSGFENAVTNSRYPELSEQQLREAAPDWIFLSSEPYPFKRKHIAEFQKICPQARIIVVDGEMFSWYGSRLLSAPAYLQTLCADKG